MADHNDPNAVNSIFSDIDVSAADLYDFFGFPSADTDGGEKVVMALTFASVPSAGVFDTDMLYRMQISGDPRVAGPRDDENTLKGLLRYFESLKEKFLGPTKAAEIRSRLIRASAPQSNLLAFRAEAFQPLSKRIRSSLFKRPMVTRSKLTSAAATMLSSTT